jgi:homoserine dehydrogenase
METTIGVAIVGCGVVGGATARNILENTGLIESRYGVSISIRAVVDKDLSRAKTLGLPADVLTDRLAPVLDRRDVDVVVELIGGTTAAFDVIRSALSSGKHVVTANKALLAHRGPELFELAHRNGRSLAFEASCGGGIPVIRALVDGLAGSRIDAIYGIVNGTCNFILSEMLTRSVSYDTALAAAQEQGLAEADPTLDINGQDSAHKIAIMASLAFGVKVDLAQVSVTGIDTLELIDVRWAVRLGYVPKLLAVAERGAGGITLRVRPCFVPNSHPLAWVSGPFNAVSVYSYPTGHTMYYGRGAGGSATGGAIVADIISIATGSYGELFSRARLWPDAAPDADQNASGDITGRYFVRVMVDDRPGMLAEIAERFGRNNISIASVHQDETTVRSESSVEPVPVIIVTHRARERDLVGAVTEIGELSQVHGPCSMISIIDEPEERLLPH